MWGWLGIEACFTVGEWRSAGRGGGGGPCAGRRRGALAGGRGRAGSGVCSMWGLAGHQRLRVTIGDTSLSFFHRQMCVLHCTQRRRWVVVQAGGACRPRQQPPDQPTRPCLRSFPPWHSLLRLCLPGPQVRAPRAPLSWHAAHAAPRRDRRPAGRSITAAAASMSAPLPPVPPSLLLPFSTQRRNKFPPTHPRCMWAAPLLFPAGRPTACPLGI